MNPKSSVTPLLLLLLSSCSPQIIGERLSEQCDLKTFHYPNTSLVAVKNIDPLDETPILNEGANPPVRFEIQPSLPPGLVFDTDSGRITGMGTAISSPTRHTVRAISKMNCSVQSTLQLHLTGTEVSRSGASLNQPHSTVSEESGALLEVTLRDSLGRPVVGNIASVMSSRSQDVIEAVGDSRSNLAGKVSFKIRSTLAGTAQLSVVDLTDQKVMLDIASIQFTPGEATHFTFAGIPAQGTAGISLGIEVEARDSFENISTSFSDLARLSHDDNWASSTGAGPVSLHFSQGVASHSSVKLTRAGATVFTIEHLPESGTPIPELTRSTLISPASMDPTKTILTDCPDQLQADQTETVQVEPRDSFGNARPSHIPTSAEVRLDASASPDKLYFGETSVYSNATGRFAITLRGWKKGSGNILPLIQGTPGSGCTLAVTGGPPVRVNLEGLTEGLVNGVTVAGDTLPNFSLHAYDIAGNQVDTPNGYFLRGFLDSQCKIPSPTESPLTMSGPIDSNGVRTISGAQLKSTLTGHVAVFASLDPPSPPLFCSGRIQVQPNVPDVYQSRIAIDSYPFPSPESSNVPLSDILPLRIELRDAFKNLVPDSFFLWNQHNGCEGRIEVYDSLREEWVHTVLPSAPDPTQYNTHPNSDGRLRLRVGSGRDYDPNWPPGSPFNTCEYTLRGSRQSWFNFDFKHILDFRGSHPHSLSRAGGLNTPGLSMIDDLDYQMIPPNDSTYPRWLVQITTVDESDTPTSTLVCPGVRVNETGILTTASCLIEQGLGLIEEMKVRDSEGNTARISSIVLHPDYSPHEHLKNLAVIHLGQTLPTFQFARIQSRSPSPEQINSLIAYSWTRTDGFIPQIPYFDPSRHGILTSNDLFRGEVQETERISADTDHYLGLVTPTMDGLWTLGTRSVLAAISENGGIHFMGFSVASGNQVDSFDAVLYPTREGNTFLEHELPAPP